MHGPTVTLRSRVIFNGLRDLVMTADPSRFINPDIDREPVWRAICIGLAATEIALEARIVELERASAQSTENFEKAVKILGEQGVKHAEAIDALILNTELAGTAGQA